jgi:arginyl-tRNA synthetase
MIRSRLKNLLDHCFQQGLWSAAAAGLYNLETPKHEGQGDFATNFAMIVAGKERRKVNGGGGKEKALELAGIQGFWDG